MTPTQSDTCPYCGGYYADVLAHYVACAEAPDVLRRLAEKTHVVMTQEIERLGGEHSGQKRRT